MEQQEAMEADQRGAPAEEAVAPQSSSSEGSRSERLEEGGHRADNSSETRSGSSSSSEGAGMAADSATGGRSSSSRGPGVGGSSSTGTTDSRRGAGAGLSVGAQDLQPGGVAVPCSNSTSSSSSSAEAGSMLMGPRHPFFSGGGAAPRIGGYPAPPLPPGFTPPAPRFDPIGPYGVEPNPDVDAPPPWGEPQQPGVGPPGAVHPLVGGAGVAAIDPLAEPGRIGILQPNLPGSPGLYPPAGRLPGPGGPPGFGFGGGGFGGGLGGGGAGGLF